jgi:peptidoglycan hydrolase-like protein with peptidoglycan-binding domain
MDVRSRAAQGLASAVTAALGLAVLGAAPAGAAAPARTATSDSSTTMQALAIYNWHLAPSLAALRTEVNTRWPYRDRSSDGAVGDARHRASTNSHNPARYPGGPRVGTQGAVHALDITARGIDVNVLLNGVVGDPRVWYVIHNGQIWSRTTNWAPRAHRGDPHTTHIHINLREDSHAAAVAAEQDTSRWLSGSGSRGASVTAGRSTAGSTLRLTTSATKALQRALIAKGFAIPSGPTGWYGPETTKAVAAFQRSQGWRGSAADGIAGALTLRRLGLSASTTTVVASASATKSPGTKPATTSGATTTRPKGSGVYQPGTASREVYFLQKALIERGYAIPAGPTGYYGSKTVDAVRAFQRAQGWPAKQCDGIPGSKTLALLGLS